jgi:hypothetical protein
MWLIKTVYQKNNDWKKDQEQLKRVFSRHGDSPILFALHNNQNVGPDLKSLAQILQTLMLLEA